MRLCPKSPLSDRDPAIDSFRGLAVLMMFLANYMEHIRVVPAWLKHAPDIGITVVDLVAPFFLFAVGLTFPMSVRRRAERSGWQKTSEHFFGRAMALVGIGMLFSIGEAAYGFSNSIVPWGTLQAIGTSVLLAFPALLLPVLPRLTVAFVVLVCYQAALDVFWLPTVLASSHAGLPGVFSWAGLLIISTVFADLYGNRRMSRYWALALLTLAGATALSFFVPVSKHRMSLSFVGIAASLAAVCFGVLKILIRRRGFSFHFLQVLGQNPLVLYCTHLVLLAVFLVPPASWWHVDAPIWQAALQGVAFVAVLYGFAAVLHSRRIRISL